MDAQPGEDQVWNAEPLAALIATAAELMKKGRFERADALLRRAATVAVQDGDPAVESTALRLLAESRCRTGHAVEAQEFAARAVAAAIATGSAELEAEACNTIGCIALETGQMVQAIAALRRTLELVATGPLAAKAHQNLGIAGSIQGRLPEAAEHYRLAQRLFLTAGDRMGGAIVSHNLALSAAARRDMDAALACYQNAIDEAEALGDPRLPGLCRLGRAELLLASGGPESAHTEALLGYSLLLQAGNLADVADACRILGRIHLALDKLDTGEAFLRSALKIADRSQASFTVAETQVALGDVLVAAGRTAEATEVYREADAVFGQLTATTERAAVADRLRALGSSATTIA